MIAISLTSPHGAHLMTSSRKALRSRHQTSESSRMVSADVIRGILQAFGAPISVLAGSDGRRPWSLAQVRGRANTHTQTRPRGAISRPLHKAGTELPRSRHCRARQPPRTQSRALLQTPWAKERTIALPRHPRPRCGTLTNSAELSVSASACTATIKCWVCQDCEHCQFGAPETCQHFGGCETDSPCRIGYTVVADNGTEDFSCTHRERPQHPTAHSPSVT